MNIKLGRFSVIVHLCLSVVAGALGANAEGSSRCVANLQPKHFLWPFGMPVDRMDRSLGGIISNSHGTFVFSAHALDWGRTDFSLTPVGELKEEVLDLEGRVRAGAVNQDTGSVYLALHVEKAGGDIGRVVEVTILEGGKLGAKTIVESTGIEFNPFSSIDQQREIGFGWTPAGLQILTGHFGVKLGERPEQVARMMVGISREGRVVLAEPKGQEGWKRPENPKKFQIIRFKDGKAQSLWIQSVDEFTSASNATFLVSEDGRVIVGVGRVKLAVWNLKDGRNGKIIPFISDQEPELASLSADGQYLIARTNKNTLRIVDLSTGENKEINERRGKIRAFDIDPRSELLVYDVFGNSGSRIFVSNIRTLQTTELELRNPRGRPNAKFLRVSQDGNYVIAGGEYYRGRPTELLNAPWTMAWDLRDLR